MIEIRVLASGSKGNCYRVTDGSTPLLLECGIQWKQIQLGLNFRTYDIAGCLVSHEHKDHCKSIKDVIRAGIDCYLTRGTQEALEVAGHRVNTIQSLIQFTIGTWTVLPFDIQHDAWEPVGFLLANKAGDKLLFTTDTMCLKYRFNGLSHIMIEANYSLDLLRANVEAGIVPLELKNRIIQSHFSLENVKEMLKSNDLSKVEGIWLLHLSDDNSDAGRFKREIQELTGKPVYVA